jgi:magnesium transporter
MRTRILRRSGAAGAVASPIADIEVPDSGWIWVDIDATDSTSDEVSSYLVDLDLDVLAIADAVHDHDLPKVDDFGSSVLVVLHGLGADEVETFEVDCFLSSGVLVTVRNHDTPALDALWSELQANAAAASGSVDVLLARLADVLTRRLMSVLDEFEDVVDGLIDMALRADARTIGEITAIRSDLTAIRRVVHPQREAVDILRSSESPLISAEGRRRFSDVFDLADRTATELVTARSVLAETLDAYRGAEARQATDVTKVLTVYAAILLPLSLITGFFGMNFPNLPGLDSDIGWIVVVIVMLVITFVSLGVFVSVGWIMRPSGRQAGATLGRGLVEAVRAPAQIGGAVFEISTMPIRAASPFSRTRRRDDGPSDEAS